MIEEIRADEAVELLLGMEKQSDKRYVDETTWNELLITALIEDGKNEEAKGKAIDAFFLRCETRFYRLYTKASREENDNIQHFLSIAKEKVLEQYISFASDIERFDLIDECITATPKKN